jgi:hypothetical protein
VDVEGWRAAYVAGLALHAGFQLTVTLVVYPALAALTPEGWPAGHARHSRLITPVVVLVYAAALAGCAAGLTHDGGLGTSALVVSVAATVTAFALTAFGAAPLHARLVDRHAVLLRRLLLVDRLRSVAAVTALAAGLVDVIGGG